MTDSQEGPLEPLLAVLTGGIAWRKCVITPAKQSAAAGRWQKLTAEPVRLARGVSIKVVTRTGKSEATSTLAPAEWRARLAEALSLGPCHLDVMAADHDWHARRTKAGRWLVTRARPSLAAPASEPRPHDRAAALALPPEDARAQALFIETGLFSKNGQLLGDAASKFRQVQHYLELLRPLPLWTAGSTLRVVDAGCGKAYLSLALLVWAEGQGVEVALDGIDIAEHVVETVSGIAGRLGLTGARFHQTSVSEFAATQTEPVDLLVSLHACDTATDEALAAGVRLGARAIVLAPCCHRELDDQIQAADGTRAEERWQSTLRSGLLRHRLADLVTDSLRADALEALGYHVDVAEFVSADITARNLMIRAVRRERPSLSANRAGWERYRALADEWGVHPSLESLLGDAWPAAQAEAESRPHPSFVDH